MGGKRRALFIAAILLLLGIFCYAVWRVIDTRAVYRQEAQAHEALSIYAPDPAEPSALVDTISTEAGPDGLPTAGQIFRNRINDKILKLREDHPNALGWISVPGTNIEYPFVQGPDNDYFLRRDVDGQYLYAGVPFLDCRCDPDFDCPNSIIYGHNLRNGTMFGALDDFKEERFFTEHRYFYVYLPDQTLCARIAAVLVVDPVKEPWLFQIQIQADHLEQVYALARQSEVLALSPSQRFITLSTCDYSFGNARTLLVGVLDDE